MNLRLRQEMNFSSKIFLKLERICGYDRKRYCCRINLQNWIEFAAKTESESVLERFFLNGNEMAAKTNNDIVSEEICTIELNLRPRQKKKFSQNIFSKLEGTCG